MSNKMIKLLDNSHQQELFLFYKISELEEEEEDEIM